LRFQEAIVTNGSIYMAVMYHIVSTIETRIPEEIHIDEVVVDERALDPDNVTGSRSMAVRLYNIGVESRLVETINLKDAGVTLEIYFEGPAYYGIPYRDIFNIIYDKVFKLDSTLLRRLAFETTKTGIEYILLYTDTGLVAVLEGEPLRVRIPFIKTAASIHTHPEGGCGLSKADIQSGLDLLVEGGLIEAAVTPSCGFVMYRRGLVNEDDYIKMKMHKGDIVSDRILDSIVFRRLYY